MKQKVKFSMSRSIDEITDDIVTLAAIGTIGFLALNGVTNTTVLGIIAGLGGFRLGAKTLLRRKKQSQQN